MAGIAGLTIIGIAVHFTVIVISVLLIVFVTINTAEEGEVVGNEVALVALVAELTVVSGGNGEPRMTELGAVPQIRAVAHRTIGGESSREVIRARRTVVIILMTEEALRRRALVLAADMAGRAVHIDMRAS